MGVLRIHNGYFEVKNIHDFRYTININICENFLYVQNIFFENYIKNILSLKGLSTN